jgi:hypothetical protein
MTTRLEFASLNAERMESAMTGNLVASMAAAMFVKVHTLF